MLSLMLCSINPFNAFSTHRIAKREVFGGDDDDKLLRLAVRYCEGVRRRAALTLTLSPRARGWRYLNGGASSIRAGLIWPLRSSSSGRSFGSPVLSGRRKSPPNN